MKWHANNLGLYFIVNSNGILITLYLFAFVHDYACDDIL